MSTTNESTIVDYCDVKRPLDVDHCHGDIPTNQLWTISEYTPPFSYGHWWESCKFPTQLQLGQTTTTTTTAAAAAATTIAVAMMLLLTVTLIIRYWIGVVKKPNHKPETTETSNKRKRKKDFLKRVGNDYGYRGSNLGYIDDWRPIEFPSLQLPLDYCCCSNTTSTTMDDCNLLLLLQHVVEDNQEREVYLDYAGAALPTRSQLLQNIIFKDELILGNPHSTGPAASRTFEKIQITRRRVLKHLKACPGKYASLRLPNEFYQHKNKNHAMDRHPGYELLFTSGATESFKILAERFPFSNQSIFLYVTNSHNSVVGMRQLAMQRGATFHCLSLQELEQMKSVNDWKKLEETLLETTTTTTTTTTTRVSHDNPNPNQAHPKRHLLVFPSECNFGGDRPNATSIVQTARDSGWYTMLDIAKDSATNEIHLKQLNPDFAALSFYKWFGDPTGVGALLVRKPAIQVLLETAKRHYQGGGSVDMMLPTLDYTVPKSELASLANGTSHFRGIINLVHGLDALDRVGGMSAIHRHAVCLAQELAERLQELQHANGMPVVRLYGAWKNATTCDRGPTVALNVYRSDGTAVGYNEVSKLGALHRPPLQFRTGCFCNPGACQLALELDDAQAIHNYQTLGHVCGDHIDLANGRPTGAIRVSFGKDSLWEDMDSFVRFIQVTFRNNTVHNASERRIETIATPQSTTASVSELYLFPIKSCAAFRVSKWPLCTTTGKLRFDREFAIVDTSGTALRMQTCSGLGKIYPIIDLEDNTMKVSSPGFEDLFIDLSQDLYHGGENAVRVCGNKCNGRVWGDAHVSEWFTKVLGIQCWLARYSSSSSSNERPGFSNEQPILLVSEHAVETLNRVLLNQGQLPCTAKRFRPNIVIRGDYNNGGNNSNNNKVCHMEDDFSTVSLGNFGYAVQGACPRCTMVDFDPTTGQKGKTLRALASYRRQNGRIVFGIFLRAMSHVTTKITDETVWIQEGDKLDCS